MHNSHAVKMLDEREPLDEPRLRYDAYESRNGPPSVFSFPWALGIAGILLVSGMIHLAKLVWDGSTWDGPLSPRKPALFGISAGLTVWSLTWVITRIRPHRSDRVLANGLALGLLVEVLLITLQYWRGVSSHFNHATLMDATMEASMLGLIVAVTVGIFAMTIRTFWLRELEPAMAIAIRSGMWLLALSCGLGILTTVLGQVRIASGQSYEGWGRAGVLKFPHGVGLHAIQVLPMAAWLFLALKIRNSKRLVQSMIVSQTLFVVYAIWQTGQGRGRFDWDSLGGCLLTATFLFGIVPVFAVGAQYFRVTLSATDENHD